MADLPRQWRSEHANFSFVPVLSEPLPEDNWPGRTGLVHQAILDDFTNLSGYQVYACGAPPDGGGWAAGFCGKGIAGG